MGDSKQEGWKFELRETFCLLPCWLPSVMVFRVKPCLAEKEKKVTENNMTYILVWTMGKSVGGVLL